MSDSGDSAALPLSPLQPVHSPCQPPRHMAPSHHNSHPQARQAKHPICTSYRPISLLSPMVKVLERLVLSYLQAGFTFAESQQGFRQARSTTSALLPITESIARGFNQRKPPTRTTFGKPSWPLTSPKRYTLSPITVSSIAFSSPTLVTTKSGG